MKKLVKAAAMFLVLSFAGAGLAQNTATPRLDKRDQKQENRIQQGEKSGQLTDREAARLEAGQAKVDAKEAAAKADGTVTKKERVKLHTARDHQSKRIYRQKHDGQKN
jgi:hypothetical protein